MQQIYEGKHKFEAFDFYTTSSVKKKVIWIYVVLLCFISLMNVPCRPKLVGVVRCDFI